MTVGDELFELVQADQGRSFIADSLDDMPVEGVLRIARGSLKHTERTARLLRKFIKKHEGKADASSLRGTCAHGQVIHPDAGEDARHRLMDYSACDCCDTLMHHNSIGFGYKVMKDGRTLCIPCVATEKQEDIDDAH